MNTIKDVARLSGTSVATVSRVINNKPVREENYSKIVAAISELSFKVNSRARSLKTNKTMTIGVIVPRLDNVYFIRIAKHIQLELRKRGYATIITDTDAEYEREKAEVKYLFEHAVDGIILVPCTNQGEYLNEYKHTLPIILLDQEVEGFSTDAVVTDSVNCVYDTVEDLVRKGHRRIAILCGPKCLFTTRDRLKGYTRVFEDYNIPINESLIKYTDYSVTEGFNAVKEYFELPKEQIPTALIATNYDLTKGAITAIRQIGEKVPHDFAFIGYDLEELGLFYSNYTSVIVEDMEKIAKISVELLLKSIGAPIPNKTDRIFRVKPTIIDTVSK